MWQRQPDDPDVWQLADSPWQMRVAGAGQGIVMRGVGDDADSPLGARLQPVGDDRLPSLGEVFVRGDELHLDYPQAGERWGLNLVVRPVAFAPSRLILAWTLGIQTTLWESHPTIDLVVSGTGLRRWILDGPNAADPAVAAAFPLAEAPVGGQIASQDEGLPQGRPGGAESPGGAGSFPGGAAAISRVRQRDGAIAVLLGPRDFPWTSELSGSDEIRLRLFGEFLERGVIRKAQPWLVLDGPVRADEVSSLAESWRTLSRSPLPLTP